jgi:hypothetical protein
MWKAIYSKDTKQLRQILSSIKRKQALIAVLNSVNQNEDTPLMAAISLDSLDLVDLLLEYSTYININYQDSESGYTALHKCLLRGNLRMAVMILRSIPANSETKDHERMTCYQLLQISMKTPIDRQEADQNEIELCTIAKMSESTTSTSLWTWGSNNNFVYLRLT